LGQRTLLLLDWLRCGCMPTGGLIVLEWLCEYFCCDLMGGLFLLGRLRLFHVLLNDSSLLDRW